MMRSVFAKRGFSSDARGSAVVEFACIAPVLMTLIVAILMVGVAYYEGATVQWSLERSLRAAMLDAAVTREEIEALMAEDLARIGNPEIALSYEIEDGGPVPLAIARAAYDVPINIPFAPGFSIRFEAENVVPVPPG